MSIHVEWVDVTHPWLGGGYIEPGGCIFDHEGDGEEHIDECIAERGALTIFADDAVVIEGPPAKLRAFAQLLLDSIPKED